MIIKEIRESFRDILGKVDETKQEGMLRETCQNQIISSKKRLDQISDSLTSMKTDDEELKVSLDFTQNDIDHGFSKLNKKL